MDQDTVRQLEGVELERIFTVMASGRDTKHLQLEELLRFLLAGDTLVVHSMDRLAGIPMTCGPWCRSSRRRPCKLIPSRKTWFL